MTSFGRPPAGGKFYYGRKEDSPVNHDVLWRAQCRSEKAQLADLERKLEISQRPWSLQEANALKEVMLKHYMEAKQPNLEELANDPVFSAKIGYRSKNDIEAEWKELHKNMKYPDVSMDLPPGMRGPSIEKGVRKELKAVRSTTTKLERELRQKQHKRAEVQRKAIDLRLETEQMKQKLAEMKTKKTKSVK